jgi:hypothetical protein
VPSIDNLKSPAPSAAKVGATSVDPVDPAPASQRPTSSPQPALGPALPPEATSQSTVNAADCQMGLWQVRAPGLGLVFFFH